LCTGMKKPPRRVAVLACGQRWPQVVCLVLVCASGTVAGLGTYELLVKAGTFGSR